MGIFDYKIAYEIAKKIISKRNEEKKTLKTETEKQWLPP
jgi:hypothetical protein